jgi:hypothetical protein
VELLTHLPPLLQEKSFFLKRALRRETTRRAIETRRVTQERRLRRLDKKSGIKYSTAHDISIRRTH